MKTIKVPGLEIRAPKSTSGDFETPPMLISGHCVVLCVGKRRSGKTTACTSLIEKIFFAWSHEFLSAKRSMCLRFALFARPRSSIERQSSTGIGSVAGTSCCASMSSMGVSSTMVGNLSTALTQLMSSAGGATGVGRHGVAAGGVGGIPRVKL